VLTSWLSKANDYGLRRSSIFLLITFSLSASVIEVFGVAIFLPIAQMVQAQSDLESLSQNSELWGTAIAWAERFGVSLKVEILLVAAALLFLFRQAFTYVRNVYLAAVKASLLAEMRNQLLKKYSEAETEYHDTLASGGLHTMLTAEVGQALRWLILPIEIVSLLILNVVYLGLLFLLSWSMTGVVLLLLLLAAFSVRKWTVQAKTLGRRSVANNMEIGGFLGQRLRSWRFPRLASTEDAELQEFSRLNKKAAKINVATQVISAKTEAVIEPIVIFSSIFFFYLGISYFDLSVETIGVFAIVALRLTPVAKIVIEKIQSLQKLSGTIELLDKRHQEMIQAREDKNPSGHSISGIEHIQMVGVSYAYKSVAKAALDNISCELRSNSLVGIVGPSGGGKSTFIDLIPRLRSVTSGRILINGVPISDLHLGSLRSTISYLPQSPHIFSGSVANHVSYGRQKADLSEIKRALSLAGAMEFVSEWPQGIETEVGEFGVRLSGGQRQRLDLARALLNEGSVLILDEPTSSLDAASVGKFVNTLNTIRQSTNLMIVMITHELRLARLADQILVLRDGMLEAVGDHDTLMTTENWYADSLQKSRFS